MDINPFKTHDMQIFSHNLWLIFLLSFLATLQNMEFLGQGSDLSHSCKCRNRSNAGSLSHCLGPGPGIEPVFHPCRDTTDPVVPQRELHFLFLFFFSQGIVDLECCVSFRGRAKWFGYTLSILFQILSPYRLLQNTEYSSLCWTVVDVCFGRQ